MTTAIGLDTYTDTAAMRSLLQALLPGFDNGSLHIDALGVRSARRNTSRERNPCPPTLCYELQVSDAVRGRAGSQCLFAQVYRDDEVAAALFARHDRKRFTPPAFGEPLVHLPALNLLLWALPNDPGLPQLPALLDPAQASRWLPAGLADGSVHVELTRYEPQRRATLRYTVENDSGKAAQTVYAKTFCDQRSEDVHARFSYFWQLSQHHRDAPLVAQPLGCDGATRSVWQAAANGVPLRQLLATADAPLLMRRVARALALLHAAPLAPSAGAVQRSVAHWLAEVRRRQNKIGRIDAALAARAAAIAAAIEAHAARPAARPLSLIHGDCHPDQVWVHDGRVVLFDFDEFTLGDPMEDLAEFVLKLEDAGAPHGLASRLVDEYATAAPHRFDARTLAWHLAIQSLLQASRTFIYQQPGWAHELPHRLAAAESRVRECS